MQRMALMILALLLLATGAQAQDFPTKPVHFITPYAPGGSSDLLVRLHQPQHPHARWVGQRRAHRRQLFRRCRGRCILRRPRRYGHRNPSLAPRTRKANAACA